MFTVAKNVFVAMLTIAVMETVSDHSSKMKHLPLLFTGKGKAQK